MDRSFITASAAIALLAAFAPAATPTMQNVAYGTHARQVLDFYQAPGNGPKPLMFYVHGGAWTMGDKANPDFVDTALASGISVVSINYRLIDASNTSTPPVKASLDDTARALQFVRSKSAAWNLDKSRVCAVGGSAGGFNALWLAFHPDMANAQSSDPVARESTRITSAFTFVPQTTLDPQLMRQWMPGINYGQHAFGLPDFQTYLNQRNALLPTIQSLSPYDLASADDPSVYMFYDSVPNLGTNNNADLVHSSNWGKGLAQRLDTLGVKYELNTPGATVAHPDGFSFIKDTLAPVPEPAAAGLLLAGGAALLARRRTTSSRRD